MGKKTSKTKSSSTPWTPAQPILLGAGQGITDIVNANQGNLSNLSGQVGGMMGQIGQQIGQTQQQIQPGLDYINGQMSGAHLNDNSANPYLTAQANGKYLNANPYTQAMAAQAGQAAGNAVNSTFSMAGRTGSGNHATDLARGVDQAQNQVYFQNYQNERGLQNQALGMLGQNYNAALGAQSQAAGMLPSMTAAQYQGYTPYLGAAQLAGQLPYYGANALGSIGGLYGGYGQQSQTQPGGWLNGLLGAGASLGSAAIMHSDRRLKRNIEKVGEARDGLGIYEWIYKSDPTNTVCRGVMADEVEKLRPHAFVPKFRGEYAGVNYGTLGSLA